MPESGYGTTTIEISTDQMTNVHDCQTSSWRPQEKVKVKINEIIYKNKNKKGERRKGHHRGLT